MYSTELICAVDISSKFSRKKNTSPVEKIIHIKPVSGQEWLICRQLVEEMLEVLQAIIVKVLITMGIHASMRLIIDGSTLTANWADHQEDTSFNSSVVQVMLLKSCFSQVILYTDPSTNDEMCREAIKFISSMDDLSRYHDQSATPVQVVEKQEAAYRLVWESLAGLLPGESLTAAP